MTTTDQVAGEARSALEARIATSLEISEQHEVGKAKLWLTDQEMGLVLAALCAQPERVAEEMRERAAKLCDEEAWGQLHLQQAHRNTGLHRSSDVAEGGREAAATLAAAIRAFPLHPAKDEGGGR